MKFDKLQKFFVDNRMGSKGTLCVGLTVTRKATETGLPFGIRDHPDRKQGTGECAGEV